ncbi:response regulator [Kosakonia sp. S42]|uniref:response regulator n=1 Tax=Kosakonia sp. S42 TaxID=2767458 RepID=UPI00190B12EB|nr:response regulator [Kosakonia sp. S42]MBK0019292.1 response regulator [Kosakonia sp. S42]
MSKQKILIVEDESNIRRFVRIALEKEGMSVFEADCGERARLDTVTRRPDLIIVDLGLPDTDGKDLIRELRGWTSVPVLVLSAREQEEEKVKALNVGADDYLIKPFGIPELVARIHALLRRSQTISTADGALSSRVRFGNVTVDLATYEVIRDGSLVHLTPIQFRLLSALVRGNGKVLTYRTLLLQIWGTSYSDRAHYLRVYMMQLRQKLEEDFSQPKYLITELQVGYRLAGLTVEVIT